MGTTKNVISGLIADKNLPDETLVKLIKSFLIVQVLRFKNRKVGGLTARMIALAHGKTTTADYLDDKNIYNLISQLANTGESYEEFKSRILALCADTKSGITPVAIGLTPKEIRNLFFEVRSSGLGSFMNSYDAGSSRDCNIIFQDNENYKSITDKKKDFENLHDVIDRIIYPLYEPRLPATELHKVANSKPDQRPVEGQNQSVRNTKNMEYTYNKIVTEVANQIQIFRLILNDKNKDGKTALDFALQNKKTLTAAYLQLPGSNTRIARDVKAEANAKAKANAEAEYTGIVGLDRPEGLPPTLVGAGRRTRRHRR